MLGLGPRGPTAAGSRGPKETRFGHSPLIESKGRQTIEMKLKKEFISGRPTVGRQQTPISNSVSKVLKILAGSYKEMCNVS